MDTSWWNAPRNSERFRIGLDEFMNTHFVNPDNGKIICLCKKCRNIMWATKDEAKVHLLCDGFMKKVHHLIY